MPRVRNINLLGKQEKGNRRPSPKNKEEVWNFVETNRERLNEIHATFSEMLPVMGVRIFILHYINQIPPKSSRIIFGNLPVDLNNIKQKTIKTFVEDGVLSTHLYYSLDNESYIIFMSQLEEILSWTNVESLSGVDGMSDILKLPENLLLFSDILFSIAPRTISSPMSIRLIHVPNIIEELFSLGILERGNFDNVSNTAFLNEQQYQELYDNYSGIIVDVSSEPELAFTPMNIEDFEPDEIILPNNANSTIIGVIDAGCSLPSQFDDFILSNEDIREYEGTRDLNHGSFVSSLIIANDQLNPGHPDNLGIFKVKHFELLQSVGSPTSFFYIIQEIKRAVENNREIKVWNLSLNSEKYIESLNVSTFGMFLDKLSYDNEVLFVVSSGNFRETSTDPLKSLGAPADALNVLSVGSVKPDENYIVHPEDYSSFGPILHFEKPEVSHYGGPVNKDGSSLGVHSPLGIIYGERGTSFSAPRVSRLAAHYIEQGFTPFESKAKIISLAIPEKRNRRNSELGWKSSSYGHLSNCEDNSLTLKMTLELSNIKPQYFPIEIIEGVEEVSITSTTMVLPNPLLGEEYSTSNIELSLQWYIDSNNPEYKRQSLSVKKDVITDDKQYGSEIIKRFASGKYFSTTKIASSISAINSKKQQFIIEKNTENPKLALRIRKQDLFRTERDQSEIVSIIVSIKGEFDVDRFEEVNRSIIEQEIDVHI